MLINSSNFSELCSALHLQVGNKAVLALEYCLLLFYQETKNSFRNYTTLEQYLSVCELI